MLDRNHQVMTRRFPGLLSHLSELAVDSQRFRLVSGVLLARLDDGTESPLCDTTDPVRQARVEVAGLGSIVGKSVLCLGLGAGYHVRELLAAVGPTGGVWVVLLHPASLSVLLGAVDLTDLLDDRRCRLIWGDLAAIADEIQRVPSSGVSPVIYCHEPSMAAARPALLPLARLVRRLRHDREQVRVAAPLIRENYRRNLCWTWAATGIDRLAGRLHGHPAVVIAAGPSLDGNVSQLPGLKGRALLLCVDTAVRRVIDAGLTPDLVCSIDPNRATTRHFVDVDPSLPLAFLPSVYPEVLARHTGPKLVALPRGDRLADRLQEISAKGSVRAAGTVTHFAIEVARRLGCDPVVFVGLDLALRGSRTHCQGASSPAPAGPRLWVTASGGGEVETTTDLDHYRQAIEQRITDDPGCRFIDATEGGALIANTVVQTLAEACLHWGQLPPLPGLPSRPTAAPPTEPPADWLAAWDQVFTEPWRRQG